MPSATNAAMEGRKSALRRWTLRFLLASGYLFALVFMKNVMLERVASEGLETLGNAHPKVLNLFQGSFYFFYEDQFLPGIRAFTQKPIDRIIILANAGTVLFDTEAKEQPKEASVFPRSEVVEGLRGGTPRVYYRGLRVEVLVPSAEYGILYSFDDRPLRYALLAALGFGLVSFWFVRQLILRRIILRGTQRLAALFRRFWRLRVKFLTTIILINLVTASIVFYSLSSLQTREQSQRIEKESVLFAQFSTSQVISDFTNFYYFYYSDRFLPEIKNTIASNENLIALRIISRRTGRVLFDSEQTGKGPASIAATDLPAADFSEEVKEQLKTRETAMRRLTRDGEPLLSVITSYRDENQEALFWIEYLFSFQTLAKSIQAVREQLMIDLVPSLGLGLFVAIVFAQLLLSPIRKLRDALTTVKAGDYNVSVDLRSSDEIGDLVAAFNQMTGELRKKKELSKFLSESTYRQVMNAADTPDGIKLGGSRMNATILFSDIRDFVGHCENLDAEEVTSMLNEYFSEMVEVVSKHGGEVDKFIGDALLAVFYSGEDARTIRGRESASGQGSSSTSLQAVYCALEMRERLIEYNEKRKARGSRVIEIGVGITHGEIISGPIGAKDRMDFTVIGDVVNLANRIEKLSKTGKHSKIVFSHQVEEKVRGLLDYVEHSREKVRGKHDDVIVYELIGIRDLGALMANLKSTDAQLRRRSVELLGQSRNEEGLPHLISLLDDEDETVRLFAIAGVAKLASPNDPRAVEALWNAIRSEKKERLLSAAITAYGKVCTSQEIFRLASFLDSPEERIVANTIEAIAQTRDPRCIDLILPKLNHKNNRIKANAAMALFAAGRLEVIDTLKPMLMHSDPAMRSSAAFAIGELTAIAESDDLVRGWKERPQMAKMFLAELQECVPMLVAMLKDPEPVVRRNAVIALGKIKDKSAVLPIIDMVDLTKNLPSRELSRDIVEALRSIGSHRLVREVISRLQ